MVRCWRRLYESKEERGREGAEKREDRQQAVVMDTDAFTEKWQNFGDLR